MRIAAMAFASVFGLVAAAVSANAAPVAAPPSLQHERGNVVEAGWACGWGHHVNRWGHCVRNRYPYYGPRAYWGGPYYRWHGPDDYVANQLNRRELGRPWGY
jgi:hypothetical protein